MLSNVLILFNLNILQYKKIILGVLILTTKFNDDFSYFNINWTVPTKYSLDEINKIENYVYQLLNYNLYIPDSVYLQKKENILNKII